MRKIVQRDQEPTPKFFRIIRNFGYLPTGISGAIVTAPISIPAMLVTTAGYMALAGTIAILVSQTALENEDLF